MYGENLYVHSTCLLIYRTSALISMMEKTVQVKLKFYIRTDDISVTKWPEDVLVYKEDSKREQ